MAVIFILYCILWCETLFWSLKPKESRIVT